MRVCKVDAVPVLLASSASVLAYALLTGSGPSALALGAALGATLIVGLIYALVTCFL
ncbi:MAG: hypothetical protein GXO07_02860 [Crenarchaeota archaeon]|nr:hypothetical protein [Thermoproteota archaeon]